MVAAMVGKQRIAVNTHFIDYPAHTGTDAVSLHRARGSMRIEIKNLAKNVGYMVGAGDEVPEALRQMGCEVTMLSPDDLVRGDLSRYDAIVTGVRAFNTPRRSARELPAAVQVRRGRRHA